MSYPNPDVTASKVLSFSTSLRNVVLSELNVFGQIKTIVSNQIADYAVPTAISNNHVQILINDITGSGDITISGTSISENTMIATTGDTETIPVDSTLDQRYQTDKKWWEITGVTIGLGISAIDYDIGLVGYTDLNNSSDWRLLAIRFDIVAVGNNPDIRVEFTKIQDDGNKKMSIVPVEDLGMDSGAIGNQIIDNIRTGVDDRSYDPTVSDLLTNGDTLVLKMSDYNTYFTNDENLFRSKTQHEGLTYKIGGSPAGNITNIDLLTAQIRYVKV